MSDAPDAGPGHLLGAIFSATPDAVVVIDQAGSIILVSPAVTDLFGYHPSELIGASLSALIPLGRRPDHQRHIERFFEAPHARQMGAGLELAGQRRDGTDFPVNVSLAPVAVFGRNYAAAFVRDASEQHRAASRLHAVNEITQKLLSGSDTEQIFPVVVQRARMLSPADAAWVVLEDGSEGSDGLVIAAADGEHAEVLLGTTISAETSRSAEVIRTGTSQVIDDLSTAPNVPAQLASLGLGPGMYVPLASNQRPLGTLVFGRARGAAPFTPLDVAFAEVFASSITAAIELGEVRAEVDRLGIIAEDERIARDLHDSVIQELFAIGMSLQAARGSADAAMGGRIDEAVDALDGVIKEVRNTIFRLPGRAVSGTGLREAMLRVADKYRRELGLQPRIAFEGPVDGSVPEAVSEHLLQVFGEGLSNIARHAQASRVEALVSVADGWLTLSLIDDGEGIVGGPSAGNGLRNIATRASELGGDSGVRGVHPRARSSSGAFRFVDLHPLRGRIRDDRP